MPTSQFPSTPGKAFQLGGQAYVYTDNKGTYAPAVQTGPGTYVPDQQKMAAMGMPQLGSKVAAPEDDAVLKSIAGEVDPARNLAMGAKDFETLRTQLNARGLHTGPQWGAAPVFGGSATGAERRNLAQRDPQAEGLLEQMEGLTSTYWPQMRPEGSGRIMQTESGAAGQGLVPMPAAGWKTAFPNIVNVDPADKGISQGLWDKYADKSNRADFVANFVHSGKGSAAAGSAAYDNLSRTPSAQAELALGKRPALGAPPGDFSGRPPGWTSSLTPKQMAAVKMLKNPSNYVPGHVNNPFVPSTQKEVDQVFRDHPGAYLLNTNGVKIPIPGTPTQDYTGG